MFTFTKSSAIIRQLLNVSVVPA